MSSNQERSPDYDAPEPWWRVTITFGALTNSRIKFNGKWVDQPVLSDGRQTDGSMAVYALPRWWVWR